MVAYPYMYIVLYLYSGWLFAFYAADWLRSWGD